MNDLLTIGMSAAVGLRVMGLKSGQTFSVNLGEVKKMIAERGEVLLYGSNKKGEVAHMFNELAKAIAVMSFLPDGIKIFDAHWRNNIEDLPAMSRMKVMTILEKGGFGGAYF